jgi:F-type H+-transporting ATPase subunit b
MVSMRKIIYRFLITVLIVIFPIFVKPVLAADGVPFLSLDNTNLVVLIAFLTFIAILLYLKVPAKITELLDNRQQSIRDEIDSATSILAESKSLLADLEREHKLNIAKAETILRDAEIEAKKISDGF